MPAELYYLSRLTAEMDVRETAAVVAMALALSLLATLYPSWRAARYRAQVQGYRFESNHDEKRYRYRLFPGGLPDT